MIYETSIVDSSPAWITRGSTKCMSEEDIINWRTKPAMIKVDYTLPEGEQVLFLSIPHLTFPA